MAADPKVFERLQAVIAAGQDGANNSQRIESDMAFHRLLLEISGIGPLLAFDSLLQIFFKRFGSGSVVDNWELTSERHSSLIHLLRDGHVGEARQVLTDHLDGYFDRLSD
jgi:DNA-binding FadR family transcriptional regulator